MRSQRIRGRIRYNHAYSDYVDIRSNDMSEYRRRNSLRYPSFDYASSSTIFVTLCTWKRQRLFGRVASGTMHLNPQGEAIADIWRTMEQRHAGFLLDTFIVMPDHLHALVHVNAIPELDSTTTIGEMIRSFKATTTARWSKGVRLETWPTYDTKLWHRNFNDRIVRVDRAIDPIRDYILANPARWSGEHGESGQS
jgi:REP element-mobilizing transposase RayT